jgi:hypothetical protein
MNKTMLSALLSVGLAGCAASPDLPSTYSLDSKQSEGLAVVSLTLSGKSLDKVSGYEYRIREVPPHGEAYAVVSQHYASARQHARSVQDDGKDRPFTQSVVVKGPNHTDALDIQNAGKITGRLAALRLSPGDYEFHTWQVREPSPVWRDRVQASSGIYLSLQHQAWRGDIYRPPESLSGPRKHPAGRHRRPTV